MTKIIFIYLCFVFCLEGTIQLKQENGVWWFINSKQEKFISLGVNHIEPHLWLAPYNKEVSLKKYGRDMLSKEGYFSTNAKASEKLIKAQTNRCKELHFNSLGTHTHKSIAETHYNKDMYYVKTIRSAPVAYWELSKGLGPMPDIFSKSFENFLEQKIKMVCEDVQDDPNLIGYLYTDVPHWVLTPWQQRKAKDKVMIYPWVNALVTRGAYEAGKIKWIEVLKSRYNSAKEAAMVWGLTVSPTYGISWEDMLHHVEWFTPANSTKAASDATAFVKLISDKWYQLHHKLIKKYDPNHLILGDKLSESKTPEWLMHSIKNYVDVVVIQSYHTFNEDEAFFEKLYEVTGKPILLGDGSHAHPCEHQLEYGVKGQYSKLGSLDKAINMYQKTIHEMFSKPYMIGWHHCGYLQQWDEAERGDAPGNENGFLDPFEKPIANWVDVIKKANKKANQIHKQARP